MMSKRIYSIVGHFGSGKTEFAVNYVLDLRKQKDKVAILDMDIANPYFRSRERQDLMRERDIDIHFNTYGYDIAEDLPAITATVRAPLENKEYSTVVDVGGNDSGARVINQFQKYFLAEDAVMYIVLNLNRPDTETEELCIEQIKSIELETGVKIEGIINNTHMLMETCADDILDGYEACLGVSKTLGIPVICSTCVVPLLSTLKDAARAKNINTSIVDIPGGDILEVADGVNCANISGNTNNTSNANDTMRIYPLTLQMRPSWLDVKL